MKPSIPNVEPRPCNRRRDLPGSRVRAGRLIVVGMFAACLLLLAGCATYHARPISPEKTAAAFEARSLSSTNLRAFLETNHVAAPAPGGAWDLKQLTLAAFYYQPALAEARAQLLAAQSAKITAGQRPNPTASVTPSYDSQIPGNFSPWLVPVSLDVPVETAGKRGKRIAGAEHLAAAARWNLVGTVWQVRSRVRAALLDYFAARETEQLLARQAQAQSNVVRLLEGQAAAGVISGFEVTPARVAWQNTQLSLQASAGKTEQARVTLAGALGLPARALAGVKFSDAELRQFPAKLAQPEVRRQALLERADVRGALAEYAASQSALQLEIANQYPDLHLGPGYAWNNGNAGDSQWSLGLTLTLPIFNQNQGPIAEARARRQAAAAHFLTVQAGAIGEIDGALAGYRAALQQAATARAMTKNLQQHLRSVRQQAQAGAVDPLTVAGAEVEFAAGEQSRLAALIQAQQALGRLEDAVQSPLTMTPALLRAGEQPAAKIFQ